MSRGITATYFELDSKFESLLMSWVTKHDIILASTSLQKLGTHYTKTNKLDLWKQKKKNNFRSGRLLITLRLRGR